jgi:hypothetical protein
LGLDNLRNYENRLIKTNQSQEFGVLVLKTIDMKHIRLSLLLLPFLVSTGCLVDNGFDKFPKRIEARTFTVNTPHDWYLYEDSGIDTYVGRIAGPEDTIYFDQGYLSFGSLENIYEDENTLFFRRLKIDGVPSILHKEKRIADSGDIRLSIYIDAGDENRLNRMYVYDTKDEEKVIRIFRSHKFK